MINPFDHICAYDPRSTDYDKPEYDDEVREPRKNCYCDDCFYGRDELALEIIRLTEIIKDMEAEHEVCCRD